MIEATDEQEHILKLATGSSSNLMINALAGTGKSTMLRMIERAVKTKPILYIVFSRAAADKIEYKANADEAEAATRCLSTTTVRTFNGCGHRIWSAACGKRQLNLDAKKSHTLLRDIISASPKSTQQVIWEVYWEVINAVAMAKALGYVPEGKYPSAKRLCDQSTFHNSLDETPDDLVSDLTDAVLTRSIQTAYEGFIDYNDQIYMPTLFGGAFPRFPLVEIDEFQDLNPVQHEMSRKLITGRVIGVGDPWQNIYAFRGAKQGGMAEAVAKFSMTPCDLSISFRCPKAIVENARWRVPHFKWLKEGGNVASLGYLMGRDIGSDSTIICRNNAPLFRIAFQLLSSGHSVSVAGSDIGPKLVAQMKKLGSEDMPKASLLSAIDDWLSERLVKESKTAHDMAASMKVFANVGSNLGQAISYAEHLFAQKGKIRLLTGHKSKGLEFESVYFLDPHLLGEDEQDLNLRYVIQTRSQNKLYEVDSRSIRW